MKKTKLIAMGFMSVAMCVAVWNLRTPSAPEKEQAGNAAPISGNHMPAKHAVKPVIASEDSRSITEAALNEQGLSLANMVPVSAVTKNNQPQP